MVQLKKAKKSGKVRCIMVKLRGLKNKWRQIKNEIDRQVADPKTQEIFVLYDFNYWDRRINRAKQEELLSWLGAAFESKQASAKSNEKIVGKIDLQNISDSKIFIFNTNEDQDKSYGYNHFFNRDSEVQTWEVIETVPDNLYLNVLERLSNPIYVKETYEGEITFHVFFGDINKEMFAK